MPNAKVTLNGTTLIDLTSDSVTASALTSGVTAHDSSGALVTGTIPVKTSADITVAGPTVSVPSGYYSAAVSTTIAYGSYKSNDSISVTPGIIINSNNGLIQSSVNVTSNRVPVNSAGYFDNTLGLKTVVAGSSSKQLDTQAATTISPTESEQIAVAAGKFTTGNVKVGAISSDYIGSNIAQRSSGDLTFNNGTFTTPSGYYANIGYKNIPVGGLNAPTVNVDTSGLVTASASISSSAWYNTQTKSQTKQLSTIAATTYIPTTTDQTIQPYKYLIGIQRIKGDANLIAANIASGVTIFGITGTHQGGITPTGTITISSNGTYDVTNYASASVNIGATVSGAKLIVPEGMIGV